MQLQLVRATSEIRQFEEIVSAFTPPMQRVCRHMTAAALREMIEHMALKQLADEHQRRAGSPRRSRIRRDHPFHEIGTLRAS